MPELGIQITQSYTDFDEQVKFSSNPWASIDQRLAKGRAIEIWDNMEKTLLLATRNPVKLAMLSRTLHGVESDHLSTIMNLHNIEDLTTWLGYRENLILPEAEEPYDTARENAQAKLLHSLDIMLEHFANAGSALPGMIVAMDDAFYITDPIPTEYQPGAKVKQVGTKREASPLEIAGKYSQLVNQFGIERDLSDLGFAGSTKSLEIEFTFFVAASRVDSAGERQDPLAFTRSLIVPGYLLPFSDDLYFEDSPVIWTPVTTDSPGQSVGNMTAAFLSIREQRGLPGIHKPNMDAIAQLAQGDSQGWNFQGCPP